MRIHRPAITGSISATNLIVSGTITAEGVQVPHGTAVSSSFAQKTAVSSSFAQKSAVSSSFALKSAISGSFGNQSVGTADSPTFAGVTTTGTLTAQTVTAQQFHTTIVSSSILYQSGSTKFGDSSDDIHQFTGSLHLVNSGSISGSSVSTGSFGSTNIMGNLNIGTTTANVSQSVDIGLLGTGAGITISGSILPAGDDKHDLGSSNYQWRDIYTGDFHLNNTSREEGNVIDGTTGNWTIQEGREDLYLLNNETGKKFKFKLEEIE